MQGQIHLTVQSKGELEGCRKPFPPLRLQVCLVVLVSELKNVRLKIIDLKGEWPEHGEAPNLVLWCIHAFKNYT